MNSHDGIESGEAWDNGQQVPVTHFDFAAFDVPITVKLTKAQQAILDREAVLSTVLLKLMVWIVGEGRKSGTWLRSVAVVWLIDGNVRNEPLAAYARRHGLTKQNLQRTITHFRDEFSFRDGRFYAESARTSARQREEKKREKVRVGQ